MVWAPESPKVGNVYADWLILGTFSGIVQHIVSCMGVEGGRPTTTHHRHNVRPATHVLGAHDAELLRFSGVSRVDGREPTHDKVEGRR